MSRISKIIIVALIILACFASIGFTASADYTYTYYNKCASTQASLVDALKSIGEDPSFNTRAKIAANNGISNYSGTAAQNISLLNLLKRGALIKTATYHNDNLLLSNLSKVNYISQGSKTCKSSAVAMAVNLLCGNNNCTTASMGGSYCNSINGVKFVTSNGVVYTGVYKTDSYIGSYAELVGAVDSALATGIPVVASVHKAFGSGTQHHWVVVVGKSGSEYQVVDPAVGVAGSVADNIRSMGSLGYELGLADYAMTHYGYVTFVIK